MNYTEADLERFESKIEHDPVTGCWLWHGTLSKSSTIPAPSFSCGGRTHQATRWIWQVLHGPIPERRSLRRSCDQRLCVNPEHRQVSARAHYDPPEEKPHGPARPALRQLGLPERVARARAQYEKKKARTGSPCQDCGEMASPNAMRCASCWKRHRQGMYGKDPVQALKNRHAAWQLRRSAVVKP